MTNIVLEHIVQDKILSEACNNELGWELSIPVKNNLTHGTHIIGIF